jgi:propanediol dehydratase large subunit
MIVNQQGIICSTRQSFQAKRTTAGEQVETTGILNIILQPVEQCFADPVRSRAQAFDIREVQLAAAPLATNDAQAILISSGLSRLATQASSSSQLRGCRKLS